MQQAVLLLVRARPVLYEKHLENRKENIRMNFRNKNQQHFEEAIVVEVVREHQEWRIQLHGVYWFARTNSNSSFKPGDIVHIVGRQGTKLIIDISDNSG